MRKKTLSVLLTALMVASMAAGCGKDSGGAGGSSENEGELKGDITFWHSFTQGGRMDVIQEAAEKFMDENPDVNITIETFSWGDFYTKWTTGLASGNVPDMSTALPGHVVEMMDAYTDFLAATPVGMLPSITGISDTEKYQSNEIVQKFSNAEQVISEAVELSAAIGFEHGPSVEAGLLTSQSIIEEMFQDIITNGTDVEKAAKAAEEKMNEVFESVQ